jgi:hypothetical protein
VTDTEVLTLGAATFGTLSAGATDVTTLTASGNAIVDNLGTGGISPVRDLHVSNAGTNVFAQWTNNTTGHTTTDGWLSGMPNGTDFRYYGYEVGGVFTVYPEETLSLTVAKLGVTVAGTLSAGATTVTTLTASGFVTTNTGMTINENGNASDFRVESAASAFGLYMNGTTGAVSVAGTLSAGATNVTGILDVAQGNVTGSTASMLVGADANTTSRTDATNKFFTLGGAHYTNAEQPIALMSYSSTSSATALYIGSQPNGTFNVPTEIQLRTGASVTATGGTAALTLDSSQNATFAGRVGLGADSGSSVFPLNISQASTALPRVTVTGDTSVAGWYVQRTGGTYPIDWYMGVRENTKNLSFFDNTSGVESLLLDATTGNATFANKVGTGGRSPDTALTAYGSDVADGIFNYVMNVINSDVKTSGVGSGIAFGYNTATSGTAIITGCAGIEAYPENGTNSNYATALGFYTRTNGGGLTEQLTISSTGAATFAGTLSAGLITVNAANQTNVNEVGTITLASTDAYAIDKGGSIGFKGLYSSGGGVATFGRIYGAKETAADGNFQGYLGFAVASGGSPAEKMRLNSDGTLNIAAGVYIGGTAAANLLDDYEEGTWTPALAFGGASVGITYGTQSGTYTKIGRTVFFSMDVDLTNKGSSTGAATISLPFTVGTTPISTFSVMDANVTVSSGTNVYSFVQSGNSSAQLWQGGSGVGVGQLTNTQCANNSSFRISGHYIV